MQLARHSTCMMDPNLSHNDTCMSSSSVNFHFHRYGKRDRASLSYKAHTMRRRFTKETTQFLLLFPFYLIGLILIIGLLTGRWRLRFRALLLHCFIFLLLHAKMGAEIVSYARPLQAITPPFGVTTSSSSSFHLQTFRS